MGERHQIYLAAGIRQCQQMGLHQLGHSPHTMPPLDPALPAQPCTLRREIPIRLLHVLLFLDYMAIRVKSGLPPHLGTSPLLRLCGTDAVVVNVALPLNLNDEELSDNPNSFVEPRPASVASDFSLDVVKFRIALLQRRINEAITSNDHFEYELVLSVDQGYRYVALLWRLHLLTEVAATSSTPSPRSCSTTTRRTPRWPTPGVATR